LDLRDVIVTPIILLLVFAGAFLIRRKLTDDITRRYFIPALTLKIFSAIAVGVLYIVYYDGGDTYNFHTHGSRHVWEAFMDDPMKGFHLLLRSGEDYIGAHEYASRIYFYNDPQSFAVIRIAAVFDLLTFSSYCSTAILFCVTSFIGLWLLFQMFYSMRPNLHRQIAIAVLFIPSVVFWGSGLLKDTITMGCLGLATHGVHKLFLRHSFSVFSLLITLLSLYILYLIKIYILLAFLPSAVIWVFLSHYRQLNSPLLKISMFPIVIVGSLFTAYFAVAKAGEDNPKYSLSALAKTAQTTAYDIRYLTGKDAGSGYSLGELDGTWQGMIILAPASVNVALFRPYLWEAKNFFMLLASLEGLAFLWLTLYTLGSARLKFFRSLKDPTVLFCLIFSLTFAFSVGIATYNFGTLMRYKIPMMPFYAMSMVFILDYSNKLRNTERFAITE
jgi:hypothetical protein